MNFLNKNGITTKNTDDYISKEDVKAKTNKFIAGLN